MRIYHNTDGLVMGTWGGVGDPSISYDGHTNPTLAASVNAAATAYRVIDGTLTRGGEPVAIAPPCDDCQTLDAVLGSEPATVQQLQAALKLLIAKPGFQRG